MVDDVTEKLRELINTQDQQILSDPNKFTSLMLDLCLGTNEREINILAIALTKKIPQRLQSSGKETLTEELRANLSNHLESEVGLRTDKADWAVRIWAAALGMDIEEDTGIKDGIKEVSRAETPLIGVDWTALDFGKVISGSRPSKTFHVSNLGTGLLTGKVSITEPWIKVSPNKFEISDEAQSIKVTVYSSLLSRGERANGHINIDSNGGPAKIEIRATVASKPERAAIDKPLRPDLSDLFPIISKAKESMRSVLNSLRKTTTVKRSKPPVETKFHLKSRLSIDTAEIDFGIVQEGKTYSRPLVVFNIGNEQLHVKIRSVNPIVTVFPEEIAIAKQEKITLTLNMPPTYSRIPFKSLIYLDSDGGKVSVTAKAISKTRFKKAAMIFSGVVGGILLIGLLGMGFAAILSGKMSPAESIGPSAVIMPETGKAGTQYLVKSKGFKPGDLEYSVYNSVGKVIEHNHASVDSKGICNFNIETKNYTDAGQYQCKIGNDTTEQYYVVAFRIEPQAIPDFTLAYSDDLKPAEKSWYTGKIMKNEFQTDSRGYTADIYGKNVLFFIDSPLQSNQSDFTLSVDVASATNNDSEICGILFREKDENNFGAFYIDRAEKEFKIIQVVGGIWYNRITGELISKLTDINNLKITCSREKIYFSLNNQILTTLVDDPSVTSGNIGLVVANRLDDYSQSVFSNFRLFASGTIPNNHSVPVNYIIPGGKPDLFISDVWIDYPTVYYTINNIGSAKSEPSTTDLYIMNAKVSSSAVGILLPGEAKTLSFTSYSWNTSGIRSDLNLIAVKVVADAGSNNSEENENNNELTRIAASNGNLAKCQLAPTNNILLPKNGKIVFLRCPVETRKSDWGNAGQVYIMNCDGTGIGEMKLGEFVDENPDKKYNVSKSIQPATAVWSPEGDKLLFTAVSGGNNWDIYTVNKEGTDRRQLTYTSAMDTNASWSPDAKLIVYSSNGTSGNEFNASLCTIDPVNGGTPVTVTLLRTPVRSLWPISSQNGKTFIYIANYGGQFGIYEWDPSTKTERKMNAQFLRVPVGQGTQDDAMKDIGFAGRLSLSPDGKRFLFAAGMDDEREIYVLDMDGKITQITKNDLYDDYPCWSPDGTKIAYVHYSYPIGKADKDFNIDLSGIYMIDVDGKNSVKIPGTSYFDWSPTWAK